MIIFSGGYNLKKKKFLKNFKYIVSFGFISTLLNFLITLTLTLLINQAGLVRLSENIHESLFLKPQQIMLYSATICATDSVAALTLISSDKYPKLFSVVFGEGMVNDAVSIILYSAVEDLLSSDSDQQFMWYTSFELIGAFFKNCVLSFLVGIFIGNHPPHPPP